MFFIQYITLKRRRFILIVIKQMSTRNLPEWLKCPEQINWLYQPTSLYKQAWLQCVQRGIFYQEYAYTHYRKCFPEFEIDITCTFCNRFNCNIVCEPHSHTTTSYDIIFYNRAFAFYWDTVQLIDFPQ